GVGQEGACMLPTIDGARHHFDELEKKLIGSLVSEKLGGVLRELSAKALYIVDSHACYVDRHGRVIAASSEGDPYAIFVCAGRLYAVSASKVQEARAAGGSTAQRRAAYCPPSAPDDHRRVHGE